MNAQHLNGKFKDLTGKIYGRLTVISLDGFRNHNSYWKCQCECGNETVVFGGSLNYGSVKSCGCLRKEVVSAMFTKHGYLSNNNPSYKSYQSWENMIRRCEDQDNDSYKNYGARGITVCEQWKNFDNFFSDMGERPAGLSLDRINNEKGYEPGNCRWANILTQNRNKHTVLKYEFDGMTLTLPEWSERTGIPRARLWQRINVAKWPIDKVLAIPSKRK